MSAKRPAKRNVYTHEIEIKPLRIRNAPPDEFRKQLEEIPYRGYEVEQISDGRSVVITKPGGKSVFGAIKREDIMVWIRNPEDNSLFLISHANVFEDLQAKGVVDAAAAITIIDALEFVYQGEEPDEVLTRTTLRDDLGGESAEVLLKVYKWIWGQEDVNYPDGKGRGMSWEGVAKNDKGEWIKTGRGIYDLREYLRQNPNI